MDSDEATKKIRKIADDPTNIVFAGQEGVESFQDAFVDEFLRDVCDVKNAWISDGSGLWDFVGTDGLEEAFAKIESKYGVNVRGNDNLLTIFRAIHAQNRTPQ